MKKELIKKQCYDLLDREVKGAWYDKFLYEILDKYDIPEYNDFFLLTDKIFYDMLDHNKVFMHIEEYKSLLSIYDDIDFMDEEDYFEEEPVDSNVYLLPEKKEENTNEIAVIDENVKKEEIVNDIKISDQNAKGEETVNNIDQNIINRDIKEEKKYIKNALDAILMFADNLTNTGNCVSSIIDIISSDRYCNSIQYLFINFSTNELVSELRDFRNQNEELISKISKRLNKSLIQDIYSSVTLDKVNLIANLNYYSNNVQKLANISDYVTPVTIGTLLGIDGDLYNEAYKKIEKCMNDTFSMMKRKQKSSTSDNNIVQINTIRPSSDSSKVESRSPVEPIDDILDFVIDYQMIDTLYLPEYHEIVKDVIRDALNRALRTEECHFVFGMRFSIYTRNDSPDILELRSVMESHFNGTHRFDGRLNILIYDVLSDNPNIKFDIGL